MPLIYSFQRENNERNNISRRTLPRTFSRYNFDYQEFESRHDDTEVVIPLFQRHRHREFEIAVRSDNDSITSSSSSSSSNSSSNNSSDQNSSDSSIIDDNTTDEEDINQSINQSDIEEEEEDDDNTTITESFTRSRVDIYRLAIRTNSEILEDLAAIIRILRQINAIYRVFHNSNNSNRFHSRRPIRRRIRRPTLLHHNNDDDDNNNNLNHSDTDSSLEEEEDDDDEANKLLEAGLEDLQTVLTMENDDGIKRQSTLALLALITYQYNHCSDTYLRQYLDPNGDYNPALAVFAAATYDEEESIIDQPPKSCQDIIIAAEELYGPDWLDEFHKGKEGALRKMLEKLTFVAQIRLKVRDVSNSPVTR
ncbi:hypothetical protein INT48_001250 [Thamnidium elegans]|uniref:Uncharacterized protein n=1 Tax=Thamnidium elegans TaxID=101142 RepID=A0A8H7SIZ3_9FUNG|nr:hypothetical protein INT48_001250 [Thamnidium elegans]